MIIRIIMFLQVGGSDGFAGQCLFHITKNIQKASKVHLSRIEISSYDRKL